MPGFPPRLAGAVQVPAAGHAHVGVESETSREVDQQVLANGSHRENHLAGVRVSTHQSGRVEPLEGPADQRGCQAGCGSVDGVAFGNGFNVGARLPW